MKTVDLLDETIIGISANKVRTALTMLGIVIGISSVIVMVSIGQGAQKSIEASIESIGSNLLQVTPGAARGTGGVNSGRGTAQTLTLADAEAIAEQSTFALAVAPDVSSRYQIVATGTNTNTSVVGTTQAYLEVRNLQIAEGSFFTDQQSTSLSKVAVLGPTVRDDLFGEGASGVGEKIRINGIQFTVIGVTEVKGGTGFGSQDDMIFVPIGTAQKFLTGSESVSTISVQARDSKSIEDLEAEVTAILLAEHRIADPVSADFSILNQADIVDTATDVTSTFTVLLAAVAGISLLVGGIGIMNMMLTSVTERTKEIGLRKAIGATRSEINRQFLAEATLITLIGGGIGVGIGIGVSFLLSALGVTDTAVSLSSILLAVGVSAVIGIVFGYYPARRASLLSPIAALRYE